MIGVVTNSVSKLTKRGEGMRGLGGIVERSLGLRS